MRRGNIHRNADERFTWTWPLMKGWLTKESWAMATKFCRVWASLAIALKVPFGQQFVSPSLLALERVRKAYFSTVNFASPLCPILRKGDRSCPVFVWLAPILLSFYAYCTMNEIGTKLHNYEYEWYAVGVFRQQCGPDEHYLCYMFVLSCVC